MSSATAGAGFLRSKAQLAPVLVLLAFAYILPGILIVMLSLGHPPRLEIAPALFSLDTYARVFGSDYYRRVLIQTVLLGLGVSTITLILGYPVAYFLARSRSRYRSVLFFLTLIPMAVGMNMVTLGWLVILGRAGFVNVFMQSLGIVDRPVQLMYTWGAIVVGLTHVLFTFMVLPITSVLKDINPHLVSAARSLGASPARAFLLVTLPLSMEGVATGFLIVFMQAIGGLVLPLLLGGQGTVIAPVLVWEQYTAANDREAASALSMVLLATALAVLVLQQYLLRVWRARR